MTDEKIPQTAELICDISAQINAHGFNHEQLLQLADNELVVAHNLLCYIKIWADSMLEGIEEYSRNAYNRMNKGMLTGVDMLSEEEVVNGIAYKNPNLEAIETHISMLRDAPFMVPATSMEEDGESR